MLLCSNVGDNPPLGTTTPGGSGGPPMIIPPVNDKPNGGEIPGVIPPNGGGYDYPPGTIPAGGNPYGTTPPGCYAPGKTQDSCIPGNIIDGGDPRMVSGGGYNSLLGSPPFGVLQGCGPMIIPYCGGLGSRMISGVSSSIHTMSRSSLPTTILLYSLVVLSMHITMSPALYYYYSNS